MIRFIPHSRIDRAAWDACLDRCPYAVLFARTWFLDAVCGTEWNGVVSGDYEAVFPVAIRRKFGQAYAHQPFFTRYFGAYGDRPGIDAAPYLEALPSRLRFAHLALHESNRIAPARGTTLRRKTFQVLDLADPFEQLVRRYAENTRRNIRKAEQAGLVYGNGEDPSVVVDLFRSGRGGALAGYTSREFAVLASLMRQCLDRGEGRLLEARTPDGGLAAAAFLMGSGGRHIFLKSGTTGHGRATGAMHGLFDHFIRSAAGRGGLLDFGGSSVPSVARFYRGFGASDVVYLHVTVNPYRIPLSLFR